MTFLPIAARELVVASRRRTTFRVRLATAIGAALVGFLLLAFSGGAAGRAAGERLFTTLAWGGFLFALSAGVLLAADTLAEEKRDGTLGLLFLTDLSGFDIVAGKLLIVGLNALLALLAALPVAAVAWILGGVTEGEFWRCALVLVNTLFLSLAVGLAVSARQRLQTEALARTFLWVSALTFGLGLLHRGLMTWQAPEALRWWLGASPWVSFRWADDLTYRTDPGRFWSALGLAHSLAWAFLAAASWTVRRHWQDEPAASSLRPALTVNIGADRKTVTVTRRRTTLRSELLDKNPVAALLAADTRMRLWIWLVAGLAMLLVGGNIIAGGEPVLPFPWPYLKSGPLFLSVALTMLLTLVKTLFAWQACEFFATTRRNGALDALLTTPLTDREIYAGQWLALRRNFVPPLAMLAAVLALGPLVQVIKTALPAPLGLPGGLLASLGSWLFAVGTLPLELTGIWWFGVWLALTETRPNWAFAKTVLFVVVLPQLAFCVPSLLVVGAFFSYARHKLKLPIRAILQGARSPEVWMAVTPAWARRERGE